MKLQDIDIHFDVQTDSKGKDPDSASTSARAGLEQDVRELCRQSPIQVVESKSVPMHHLALTVRRQRKAERSGHVAVHIPFDIGNL